MEIIQRRLLSKKKTTSLLPKAYQRVERLESTGTQYIDTNQAFTHPISFKIRAQKLTADAQNVFGAIGTTTDNRNQFGGSLTFNANSGATGAVYAIVGRYNQYYSNYNVSKDSWCDIEFGCGFLNVNGVLKTFGSGNKSSSYNITLFGLNDNGTVAPSSLRVSMFQIFSGDDEPVIVRDFVPCYRKSDGVIGMYDLCGSICPLTGTPFYINAGAGEFIKGDDVNAL